MSDRTIQLRLPAATMRKLRILAALLDKTPAFLIRVKIDEMLSQNKDRLAAALLEDDI